MTITSKHNVQSRAILRPYGAFSVVGWCILPCRRKGAMSQNVYRAHCGVGYRAYCESLKHRKGGLWGAINGRACFGLVGGRLGLFVNSGLDYNCHEASFLEGAYEVLRTV